MSDIDKPNGAGLGPEFMPATMEASKPDGAQVAEVEVMLPVFEVIIPSALAGVDKPAYHFKFWGDGKVEGFQALAAEVRRIQVVNRIPALLDQVAQPLREFVADLNDRIDELAGDAKTEEPAP